MNDDDMLELFRDTGNSILKRLNAKHVPSPVTRASEMLLCRIIGAGDSLATLRKESPHNYALDGAMILRGIYDAMLQVMYILHRP